MSNDTEQAPSNVVPRRPMAFSIIETFQRDSNIALGWRVWGDPDTIEFVKKHITKLEYSPNILGLQGIKDAHDRSIMYKTVAGVIFLILFDVTCSNESTEWMLNSVIRAYGIDKDPLIIFVQLLDAYAEWITSPPHAHMFKMCDVIVHRPSHNPKSVKSNKKKDETFNEDDAIDDAIDDCIVEMSMIESMEDNIKRTLAEINGEVDSPTKEEYLDIDFYNSDEYDEYDEYQGMDSDEE